jgi:hypothetical protein
LIIRHNRVIGDREQVEHDMMGLGSVERWLEAELELRRALGDEPGGVRRGHMRIRAPRGDIIVRFYDYAGDEPPKVPELGPFYVLTVGKREVRADDKLLAIRSTDMSPWTLTDQVRPGIAGINKADFSVFSLSARDPRSQARTAPPGDQQPAAPSAPAPTAAVPAPAAPIVPPAAVAQNGTPETAAQTDFTERRKIQREIYVARPLPQQDEQLTPADVNLILRVDKLKQQELAEQLMIERLRREQHIAPESALRADAVASLPMRFQPPVKERVAAEAAEEEEEYEGFTQRLLGLLWSARIVLVTGLVLVALVAAYGYLQAPTSPLAAGGAKALTFAGVNERVQTNDWTIVVTSVDRLARLGPTPPAQGQYVVVHVTATRKNSDAPTLDPSQFVLVDPAGAQVFAFPTTADMYSASSGVAWPARFPVGTALPGLVIFDVHPNAKSLQLLIKPANVQVRIPDPN